MKHRKHVRRDVLVRFLVTKQERDAIRAAAKADGVPLALWIRMRCFTTTTAFRVAPPLKQEWVTAQEKKQ